VSELSGKRVLVVGLGTSGFAAATALLALDAKVRVTDAAGGPDVQARAGKLRAAGAEVEVGGHDLDRLDADLAVLSPGVGPGAAIVRALAAGGIETIGEVELAYRLSDCDFVAVTGTNGKTTTTSLVAAMLQEGGIECVAAGNIGVPLIEAVASIRSGGAIAVEVSSFQLQTIDRFRPRIAVLLNVAEDHTDWHGSFDEYAAAKARIVLNHGPGDVLVANFDDAIAMRIARRTAGRVLEFSARRLPPDGIGIALGEIVWRDTSVMTTGDVPLPGLPGLEDAVAAAGAALEYGVDVRAVARAAKGFRPLRHRLETVAEIDGVTYIDDSKATNPHATLAAVRDLEDVVLIAGGRSKGIDLAPLSRTVPPVRAVVALGEAAAEIERVFAGAVPVDRAASMADAVERARARAIRGGSVLLSPGCASLDMYADYAARGEAFIRAVRAMLDDERATRW
jgi:UDP-N-acetylmuramoylalanine--D-glutamate ligase